MTSLANELLLAKSVTNRKLAKIAGSIISMKFVMGDITQLKSRAIENKISWDSKIDIKEIPEAIKEIKFWKNNLTKLNCRSISEHHANFIYIFSDASNNSVGIVILHINAKSHRNLKKKEKSFVSTWRELQAIVYGLKSFKEILRDETIHWFTDNNGASIIAKMGSKKTHLQELALEIYDVCRRFNIRFKV